tara:strand:+ start:12 stop:467 length:456 start_codon:yes stop_codon:yes gene_type:complete
MPNELTIKFSAAGNKELLKALKDLAKAQRELDGSMKNTTSAGNELAQSQHLVDQRMSSNVASGKVLQATFATLRNKLLLFSFALTMAVKPMLKLVDVFSEAEEIASKFNVVFGKQASLVREWASALGAHVGRAQQELEGMLSTLQDTFVPL